VSAAYLKSAPVLPTVHVPYWCAGKQRFESAVLATQVAARAKREPREIYLCRSCGTYHIGRQNSASTVVSKVAKRELIR